MTKMPIKLKLKPLGYVVASIGGAVGCYFFLNDRKANMSWTTNYTPSVQWDWNWDKREPSSLVKPSHHPFNSSTDQNNNALESPPKRRSKSSPTRHLIFIRHGQYNLEGLTDEDKALSQLGREQAALAGERLKSLPWPYTRLIYSTMTRATETALIIQDKLNIKKVEKCDLLREGAPIPPEPPVGNWKTEMHKYFIDGSRIEAAFRKYFHRASPSQTEDSYEIFVCHGNVIRYFVCRGLQLPPEAWLRMSLNNGSITYFTIRPDGRVALRLLGDCGFMSPDKLSLN